MPKKLLRRSDFKKPEDTIPQCYLSFEIKSTSEVTLHATSEVVRTSSLEKPFELDANFKFMEIESIAINKQQLTEADYVKDEEEQKLIIANTPEVFTLDIKTRLNPATNDSNSGLYVADDEHNILATQCETYGFRQMTPFKDEPINRCVFAMDVTADMEKFPTLLSNGDLIKTEIIESLEDDLTLHKKYYAATENMPSYLFGLVAGPLDCIKDEFLSINHPNRKVDLGVYVTKDRLPQVQHAMEVLKKAMAYFEDCYGLTTYVNTHNLVGLKKFNAGAMENVGLNTFTQSCLFAKEDMQTDFNFKYVTLVVAHELAHTWAGNLVGIDNFFHIFLKEGLATLLERQCSAVLNGAASTISRMEDVHELRTEQFLEEQGSLAHPVRLDEAKEVSNFYTATSYSKGAELYYSLSELIGFSAWKVGILKLVHDYKGQTMNLESFMKVMEEISGRDLSQWMLWYSQVGTPMLKVSEKYEPEHNRYTLTIKQEQKVKEGEEAKLPLHIPFAVGLLDSQGEDMLLQLESEEACFDTTKILEVRHAEDSFTFINVNEKPVPSLLRNFSAPVKIVESPLDEQSLKFLLMHDSDYFNRWDAAVTIVTKTFESIFKLPVAERNPRVEMLKHLNEAFGFILADEEFLEPVVKAKLLNTIPSTYDLLGQFPGLNLDEITAAHELVVLTIAQSHEAKFFETYKNLSALKDDSYSVENAGNRDLKNTCLSFLLTLKKTDYIVLCKEQYLASTNMTDKVGALNSLNVPNCPLSAKVRNDLLDKFYLDAKNDTLLINKWFNFKARTAFVNDLEDFAKLVEREDFDVKLPSRVLSVSRGLSSNVEVLHNIDGSGYQLYTNIVQLVDSINSNITGYFIDVYSNWKNLDVPRQKLLISEILRLKTEKPSNELAESIDKILADIPKDLLQTVNAPLHLLMDKQLEEEAEIEKTPVSPASKKVRFEDEEAEVTAAAGSPSLSSI